MTDFDQNLRFVEEASMSSVLNAFGEKAPLVELGDICSDTEGNSSSQLQSPISAMSEVNPN
jgi:hypothetical protein